jgi:hypothetical protein
VAFFASGLFAINTTGLVSGFPGSRHQVLRLLAATLQLHRFGLEWRESSFGEDLE